MTTVAILFCSGLYLIFSIPALILSIWAQIKVKFVFHRYSIVRNNNGYTGAQVARRILDMNGLSDIKIEETTGFLSDHYDPARNILRLSPDVYHKNSIAAAGIAAHEAGHALQDSQEYFMLNLRTFMAPAVTIVSWVAPVLFIIGMVLSRLLALFGLLLFSAMTIFTLITLPVEFNASKRAKTVLNDSGIITQQEAEGVDKVLDAAAWTYVAASLQAIAAVLYYAISLLKLKKD